MHKDVTLIYFFDTLVYVYISTKSCKKWYIKGLRGRVGLFPKLLRMSRTLSNDLIASMDFGINPLFLGDLHIYDIEFDNCHIYLYHRYHSIQTHQFRDMERATPHSEWKWLKLTCLIPTARQLLTRKNSNISTQDQDWCVL